MADETLVINLKIDATQSAKSIEELTKRNRELAKVIKQAPREGQEGFKELNKELNRAKQEFAKNREEITKFNRSLRETDVAADSLKGLSRQLRTLENDYKKLGKAEREDAFGQATQRRIKQIRDELKRQEAQLGDARRNVGNYGKEWQRVGSRIAGVGRATGAALAVTVAVEGLQVLNETITRFSELRNEVETFSGASGEALDQFVIQTESIAQTFDTEATEIGSAARALSQNLGIEFGEALTVIEDGFLAGADANGDFLSSLESLSGEAASAGVSADQLAVAIQQSAQDGETANAELVKSYGSVDTTIKDLIDTGSDFTKQQKAQLTANRDLAAAQNQITKQLAGSAASIKLLGTNIATFALTAFSELIEIVSPLTEAFGGLFDAIGGLLQRFGLASEGGSAFQSVLNASLVPLRLFTRGLTFVVNTFTSLTEGASDYIDQSPILTSVIESAGEAFTLLGTIISSIPAFFSGVAAAGRQAGTNIANFFRKIAIDAQILFQKIQQINPFGPTQEQIDATVADLRRQRAELEAESIGIFDAFGNAFNEALEQTTELSDEIPEAVSDAADKVEDELKRGFSSGTKKGVEAAKEEIEKLAEAGSLQNLRDIISTITGEFGKLTVGTDEFKAALDKLIEAENNLAEAEKQVKEARETDSERQARIAAELQAVKEKNDAELQAARDLITQESDLALQAKIITLSEERNLALAADNITAEQRLQIEKDFETAVLNANIQAQKEKLNIVAAGTAEELTLKQSLLDAELSLLEQQLEDEAAISEERLRRKEEEGGKLADLEKAIIAATLAATKQLADTGFSIAIKKSEERKNKELELVRAEFAEKFKLAAGNTEDEERLRQELANREKEIAKKAAEEQRALSITKAIIAGALGAVQTIANLGFPAAIPGLIAVVAATAANIATITSQKLEKGGVAKLKFDSGGIAPGRRHSQGGTPAVIGGQEAVEIEVGEAITNRNSTARFMQTLSDINQAEGGVRFAGTRPLTSERLFKLDAFEMLSGTIPKIAERGLSPRLSPSIRTFQNGGTAQTVAANFGNDVEFQGNILTEADVRQIAKAAAEGTRQGIEQANLFSQFRRQAEREINQNDRSQV
jgi:uncharacterized protein YggU (UPF0235/DUF167 family)